MIEPDEKNKANGMNRADVPNKRETRAEQVPMLSTFIETRQYHRFVEVGLACQQNGFIAICHGEAGVGKTRSARCLTHWDQMERQLSREAGGEGSGGESKVAFFTPDALMSAKRLEQEILHLHAQMKRLTSLEPPLMSSPGVPRGGYRVTGLEWKLLVIDEADRVKPMGLEVLRDLFDRSQMGLMLIGMPGIEKRLARYPQFFSRVGFVHEFCALSAGELREIVEEQLRLVKRDGEEDLPTTEALDEEALAAIIRMTSGNFRLIHRLLVQIERILRINHLSKVTKAVVEAARASLVFGREG